MQPWSPAVHKLYPKPFRETVHTLLLCCSRFEPLAKLPEVLVHELIAQLAYVTFWGAPTVDLTEGEDVKRDASLPAHKQPSYNAKDCHRDSR